MVSIIFKQIRMGHFDKAFYIYKFKTMDEHGNSNWLQTFLRRTGLDELPQIINLLRGEMVLVGPRPLTPEDHERYRGWALPVKPGLTGWWQIHGRVRVQIHRLDLDYLHLRKEIGIWIDLYILWKTIPLVLLGRHG